MIYIFKARCSIQVQIFILSGMQLEAISQSHISIGKVYCDNASASKMLLYLPLQPWVMQQK
jgi:hypothetical protein